MMKTYFYLLVVLMTCQITLAQLSVRNNAFIFAEDIVVFVEDDVNLNETNSKFYLRDEAQLIQGAGNTPNTGDGALSVYQEGNVNPYAFNSWCSPVGYITAGQQSFTPNQSIYDANNITNSVLANYTTALEGTSGPLAISSRWLYKYDAGDSYADWDKISPSDNVDVGYGFIMKGTTGSTQASGQLYDFRGIPNQGDIIVVVEDDKQTLTGNPYPSALDAAAFLHDARNKLVLDDASIRLWEQDQSITSHYLKDYEGGYYTFTINADGTVASRVVAPFYTYNPDGTNNTLIGNSTSGKKSERFLPIGQGFMITGGGTSNGGDLTFSDSHREFYKESGVESEFFRTNNSDTNKEEVKNTLRYNSDGFSIVPEDYKRFRLNIDFGNNFTRQLLQNFHTTATTGKDYGLESKIQSPLKDDANWIQEDEPYLTQANAYAINLKIPVIITLENSQSVRFNILDVQNFDTSQAVFIHDISTDTYTDLRKQSYETSLEAGLHDKRFEVTFKDPNVITNDPADFLVVQNQNENTLVIHNLNNSKIESATLFDVTGKKVFKKSVFKDNTRLTFSTKNLNTGVYIAKVKTAIGEIVNKKIIISN